MPRRALALCSLILLVSLGFVWLARDALHGTNVASTEAERAFAQTVLKSLEGPVLSPWYKRVTALLQDNPRLARYIVARPGPKTAAADLASGHTLTFPHFANGAGGGVVIKASVTLINNGGATATGRVYLWQNTGQPMSVATNLGTGSSFDFTLTAGATLRLDTDGTGGVVVGWVEVRSDVQISGAGKFTTFDSAGRFISEVGIGDSVRAKKLMIVVDTTGGKRSAFAVCNPDGTAQANLSLNLRRMDGSSVATVTRALAKLSQKAEFVDDVFGAAGTNVKGVLVITSDSPQVAVVTLQTQGFNYTSLPAVPEVTAENEEEDLVFARIGDGVFGTLKLQTSFFLINNSATPVSATVELFAEGGGALALRIGSTRSDEFAVTVPAGGALALQSDGTTNPGKVGWARVTPQAPLGGGAALTVTTAATGALQADVGVPASPLTPMPAIYVQEQADSSTALALTNPTGETVTVRLTLTGRAGASPEIQATKTMDLAPLSHVALYVPELFSDVPAVTGRNFSGRLEAEAWVTRLGGYAPSEVAGLTLLSHGAYLTSAPIAQFVVNFGPRVTISPATLLGGTAPAFRMGLGQLAGEIPLKTGTITLNKGSVDLSKFQKGQSVGQLSTQVLVYLLMGKCFVFSSDATAAQFFSPLTTDGVSDWEPFFVKVSNVPGGGVKFEVTGQSKGEPDIMMSFAGLFDLLPDLVRLPPGAGTEITITEDHVSDPLPGGTALRCSRTRTLTTGGLASGAPQIHSVTPSTVVGGQQISIQGSNFSSTPAANSVTVEGNSRVAATVLQASTTSLLVQLPDNIKTGPLQVASGGKNSNDYTLLVPFAPMLTLTPASRTQAGTTGLRVELAQRSGEIAFHEVNSTPSQGEWITAGFAAGAVLGTAGLESPLEYQLKVKSSDADKLLVDVIEPDDTKADYLITICKSCTDKFRMEPTESSYSYVMPTTSNFVINFTTPIFRNPSGAGQQVRFSAKVLSQPRRTMVPTTRLSIERQLSYATQ